MSLTVTPDQGDPLPLDSLPQTFTYSGSQLTAITVVYAGNTYVQTFTWSGTTLVHQSNWVKQ